MKKKFFSFLLVAAGLLCSGMASAANVSTEAQLRNAIENAAVGATVDITLTQDIALDATLQIYAKYAEAGKTINLDLNDHVLSNNASKAISVIEIFKGTLNISNGTVKCTYPTDVNSCKDGIILHGVYQDQQDWSILNVAENAKVISDKNAITIMEFWGINYYANADAAYAGVICDGVGANPSYDDANIAAYTYPKNVAATPEHTGSNGRQALGTQAVQLAKDGKIDFTSSMPKYGTEVKNTALSKAGVRNYVAAAGYAYANGVNVNIRGYVRGGKYGIKVNGNLRNQSTYQPNIVIAETAEIACSASSVGQALNDKESTAIYCSGEATWTIKGYVHGNIGVTIKGGKVDIDGATIEGTGTEYEALYKGSGSGINGGSGCGIVIASQSNYGGGQSVTITGDTKVSSVSGYAIEEAIVSGGSQVANITIEGGTITSGNEGAMKFTEETVNAQGQTENKVTVITGNIQGTVTIGNQQGDKLADIQAEGTFQTVVEIDGVETIVVSHGEAPAATLYNINDDLPASVKLNDEVQTLADSKSVDFLLMQEGAVLTIPTGKVLTLGKLVMGAEDQIIIENGGKLIISGEEGIVAGNAENLIIKAGGIFIFNPAVRTNRTPWATVEYVTSAAVGAVNVPGVGQKYIWDMFVNPFASMTSFVVAEGQGTIGTACNRYVDGAWVYSSREDVVDHSKAFESILITTNVAPIAAGVKYILEGQLQGNISGKFYLTKGFNFLGNAYLGMMNAKQAITAIQQSGASVRTLLYKWNVGKQGYDLVNSRDLDTLDNLDPMTVFVLYADEDVEVNLDYKKLVYDVNK